VDAPLAQDLGSDEESDDEIPDHGGDSSDEDDVDAENDEEEEEEEEEEDNEEESDSDSDSDSAPEFDGASAISDDDEEVGGEGQYEEKGANAPRIIIPEGVVDFSYDEEEDVKGKGKGKAIWHDSADDRISVDMEKDNRMKKLARGKKGGLVDGQELQKRLRQQYVPA
jgi:U3 small nucleolar RNA-associated protein 18